MYRSHWASKLAYSASLSPRTVATIHQRICDVRCASAHISSNRRMPAFFAFGTLAPLNQPSPPFSFSPFGPAVVRGAAGRPQRAAGWPWEWWNHLDSIRFHPSAAALLHRPPSVWKPARVRPTFTLYESVANNMLKSASLCSIFSPSVGRQSQLSVGCVRAVGDSRLVVSPCWGRGEWGGAGLTEREGQAEGNRAGRGAGGCVVTECSASLGFIRQHSVSTASAKGQRPKWSLNHERGTAKSK